MAEMVRVNTRISKVLNDWLDARSEESGVPKSTMVMLALEQYWQEKEVLKTMSDMGTIMRKLEELETKLEKK